MTFKMDKQGRHPKNPLPGIKMQVHPTKEECKGTENIY